MSWSSKSQEKRKKEPVRGGGSVWKDTATYLRTAMASSMVLASTDPSSRTLLLMFSSKGTSRCVFSFSPAQGGRKGGAVTLKPSPCKIL